MSDEKPTLRVQSVTELAADFLLKHTLDTGTQVHAVEHVDKRTVYAPETVAVESYLRQLEEAEERQPRFEVEETEEVITPLGLILQSIKIRGKYFYGFKPRTQTPLFCYDRNLAMVVTMPDAETLRQLLVSVGHDVEGLIAPTARGSL